MRKRLIDGGRVRDGDGDFDFAQVNDKDEKKIN